MDSFESIVKGLKTKPGLSFGFAAYEGSGSPIGIIADKKKTGKSLETQAKKKGALLASGSVHISPDGKSCTFSCGLLKPGFKANALKPYFAKLPLVPDVEAAPAEAVEPGSDDDPVLDEDDGNIDETLVTLWSKQFDRSLVAAGVEAQVVAQYNGIDTPVTLRLPKYFIKALKSHSAEAFAARIVDSVNKAFDAECARMKKQIGIAQANPGVTVNLNENVLVFQERSEKIVETAWDAFVTRYEVTKGFKKKRFRAIAVPVIGGMAAVVGTTASFATGNIVGGVAGTIAALRATVALITAWRQYARDLEKILKSMEGALERLSRTYIEKKTDSLEHMREGGLVALNAFAGGGLAKTFKSVKDTIDIFKPRLAMAERTLDKLMAEANTAIAANTREIAPFLVEQKALQVALKAGDRSVQKRLKWVNYVIESSHDCGQAVTDLLDKIADGNATYRDMGVRVSKLEKVIITLNAGKAMTMEQAEKVMAFVVNFASTAANLSIGIATAGMVLDGVITTIGGLADTHDMLASEWDALDATVG